MGWPWATGGSSGGATAWKRDVAVRAGEAEEFGAAAEYEQYLCDLRDEVGERLLDARLKRPEGADGGPGSGGRCLGLPAYGPEAKRRFDKEERPHSWQHLQIVVELR